MKKLYSLSLLLFVILLSTQGFSQETERVKFDPNRNPVLDLKAAQKQAKHEKKRILLDVGGEWCPWCHKLDEFIEAHQDIKTAMNDAFIVLKINYSKENKNEEFLNTLPKVAGYPHYFVLDAKGKLVHSQDTGALEDGKSYSHDKLLEFFKTWKTAKEK
jgi:thioredoxin-related protein